MASLGESLGRLPEHLIDVYAFSANPNFPYGLLKKPSFPGSGLPDPAAPDSRGSAARDGFAAYEFCLRAPTRPPATQATVNTARHRW